MHFLTNLQTRFTVPFVTLLYTKSSSSRYTVKQTELSHILVTRHTYSQHITHTHDTSFHPLHLLSLFSRSFIMDFKFPVSIL